MDPGGAGLEDEDNILHQCLLAGVARFWVIGF